ncbi:MAG TPA: hypothetical protein VKK61_03485, partial [Tepidisphaeraceae bacterium]|nr:hypothetical protein [Tepidisphaeraceae bacterium]
MFSVIFEALERRALMSATVGAAVPIEVAAVGATTVATTQAAPTSITIFSWSPTRDPSSIQSAIWASLDQDPAAEAQRIAPLLKQCAAGQRTVFLW